MSATFAQAEKESLPVRERRVEEIERRAQQWRLMDCSESTLKRMRAAVDAQMAEHEQRLEETNELFLQYVQVGNPIATEQSQETINRLSAEWNRLRKRLREIDNVLQERHLRNRLIGVLGSEARLNFLDGIVFVLILIVVALTLVEMIVPGLPEVVIESITIADTIICFFLLTDFFLRMALSEDKGWYFRHYWIDLISSIPLYAILRFGRLVKIARFFRLLRLLRLSRAVRLLLFIFRGLDKLVKTFELNLLKRSVLIALALLVFGALAISALEGQREQNIQDLGESLWWSFATVVTGGFADLYNPQTPTGRVVTVGMILLGLTVTGIFTASLTSVLVEDESSKLEQNQHRFDEHLQTVNHKLDLLTGETTEALVALETVAQAVSNQPSPEALADLIARSLTTDFDSLQASVHLLDDGKNELIRLSHAGLETVAPPERIPLGEGFLGRLAVELSAQDMTKVDLEPQTHVCMEVQGMVMLCPLAAGRQFLGLVHVVLPRNLANDYLYTRVPMTLAHNVALAFYAARLTGSGS
ncbi:MAG TPA: ion transporter [Anaerolineae bacterium]|nr:ion transporter [Anaerolineae bacterium]